MADTLENMEQSLQQIIDKTVQNDGPAGTVFGAVWQDKDGKWQTCAVAGGEQELGESIKLQGLYRKSLQTTSSNKNMPLLTIKRKIMSRLRQESQARQRIRLVLVHKDDCRYRVHASCRARRPGTRRSRLGREALARARIEDVCRRSQAKEQDHVASLVDPHGGFVLHGECTIDPARIDFKNR